MTDRQNPIDQILESEFWPEGLAPGYVGGRIADDNDGDPHQQLGIMIGNSGLDHGDVYVQVPGTPSGLRFRTYIGGGGSPRVRNALLVLAEAIRRDNAHRPQPVSDDTPPQPMTQDTETAICLETLKRLSSGEHLDPDVMAKTTPEQQEMIKQAIMTTAMEVFENTWKDFQSR